MVTLYMHFPVSVCLLLPRDGDHLAKVAGADDARGIVDDVLVRPVRLAVILLLRKKIASRH